MSDPAVIQGDRAWRYAQARGGLRLHLAEMVGYTDGVKPRAVCGYRPDHWRMTINMPLAHACRRCTGIMWPKPKEGTAMAQGSEERPS